MVIGANGQYYNVAEEDVEVGGIESLCPNCVEKFTQGEKLSSVKPVRLVELPLNAKIEDILGSVDERAAMHSRIRVKRGILSIADKNLLYIDEVNLLRDEVVDAILDAAAQGSFTIRRGQFSAMYRSRFTLIGTMNPEEGTLRPQIMDRFGLRLLVKGLDDIEERKIAYERAKAYLSNPKRVADRFADATLAARDEILAARKNLSNVGIPEEVTKSGLELIQKFKIASIRAEITLFEAARALAAADNRLEVSFDDLQQVAPMALRLRRSQFIDKYFDDQNEEEEELYSEIENLSKENGK